MLSCRMCKKVWDEVFKKHRVRGWAERAGFYPALSLSALKFSPFSTLTKVSIDNGAFKIEEA